MKILIATLGSLLSFQALAGTITFGPGQIVDYQTSCSSDGKTLRAEVQVDESLGGLTYDVFDKTTECTSQNLSSYDYELGRVKSGKTFCSPFGICYKVKALYDVENQSISFDRVPD